MLQSPHSAVATFTEAIRADPDYAFAYAGRPVARSLAFADFARALVSGPGVGDYNMWLGISYYLSGDTPRPR